VAPAHGFDYWRESICAAFDPMSPELAVDQRSSFCGDITAWNIGEACLMKIHASGHVTGRSPQDIAHGSHDYVFLYRQMAAAWFDLGDGTSFVTQCPIIPKNSYQYDFNIPNQVRVIIQRIVYNLDRVIFQAGTFWYHSHITTQYCDGLRGPLVVYDPHDPHASLYDIDNGQYCYSLHDIYSLLCNIESTVITVADW